jgi:hypothetical protein
MQIGEACGTGLVRSLSDNHLDLLLNAGTTYYWKVRAHNDCDEWTNWSPCHVFRTATDVAVTPSQTYPPDGTDCVAAESGLGWSDDPDAASWDVELGEACGEGTIFNVTEHHLHLSDLSDGVTYYWRVRVRQECGLVSDWSPCRSFSVDLVAPSVPTNLVPSHAIGVWSNDDTIYVDWDAATDNCWTPGYSYVFDNSPMTIPDDVPDVEEPGTVSDPLPDGDDHWFHVKAVDGAGNVSDTVHLGPFRIDTTKPTEPQFEYTTIEPGASFGVAPFIVDWTASSDESSGVAGYSWWLDIDPAPLDQPDLEVETTATTFSGEFELQGMLWFFLRAVDAAGNGSDIATLGPFICDHELLGVGFLSPTRVDVLTEGEVFPISWWLYDDGDAVLQMGRLEYSLDAGDSYQPIGNLTPSLVEAGTVNWTVPAVGSQEAVLRLSVWDMEGRVVRIRSERFTIEQVTDVSGEPTPTLDRLALGLAQPNPFNASTMIYFDLPQGADVQLCIYDSRGRRVRTLLEGWRDGPRRYEVTWDGLDDHGGHAVSGVYLYQLRAADQVETKRMVFLK